MSRCLKIIDVFDEPHRCSNETNGFKAYCDEHMPKPEPIRFPFDLLLAIILGTALVWWAYACP